VYPEVPLPFLPVGGQAVLEGVMMRSPSLLAVAVRRPDGSLAYLDRPFRSVTARIRLLGLPVLRGAVALFETLYLGMTALNFSADEMAREEGQAESKPSPMQSVLQGLTLAVSLGLGLLLFVVLPARLTVWVGATGRLAFGLVDGLFRLTAFLLYLFLISQWKEMTRVLRYHGAEHKAIHALEARAPLTPESVQTFSRFHPRCGTTFLFIVVVVSIVVFTLVGRPHVLRDHLVRIACMPLIAGVAFEFIRLTGKHQDKAWVRALTWPGVQFQRLTTREPDLEMCAVAIAALERVRGDETVRRLEAAGASGPVDLTFVQ
jgi:uncharacterized protein YqhQ